MLGSNYPLYRFLLAVCPAKVDYDSDLELTKKGFLVSRVSRRDFCRQVAQTGLTLAVASPLTGLLGCGGSVVNPPFDGYDAIIVGGGTAGAIVASKLRVASGGGKRILIIEAGGPDFSSDWRHSARAVVARRTH